MTRRLAIISKTQLDQLFAGQTAAEVKGCLHAFATAEHGDKNEAQYCVQRMEPAFLPTVILNLPQYRAYRYHPQILISVVITRKDSKNITTCNTCVFRRIRPPIPTTCAHLFRGIRPPVTHCREAAYFGYQS
jgi:hypothetical protein